MVFFYSWPLVHLPVLDGFLIPLNRHALRNLTAPAETAQDLPDMSRVVFDFEFLSDDAGYAFQRPQVVWKPVSQRTFEQYRQEAMAFTIIEFARSAGDRFGCQRLVTAVFVFAFPPEYRSDSRIQATGHLAHRQPDLQ